MKRVHDNIIEVPLVDALYHAQTNAFDEHYKSTTRTTRRTLPMSSTIGSSYYAEVSTNFRKHLLNFKVDSGDQYPVHMIGNKGLMLIWTTSQEKLRVSVEAGVLSYLLEMWNGNTPSNNTISEYNKWFCNYKWSSNHCVVGANWKSGWMGAYTENRLWKALAHYIGDIDGINIQDPIPSMIRSWFAPEILAEILKCLGKERAISVIRQTSRNNWLGCPDLFLWMPGTARCVFVEVKSSTDRMRSEQSLLKRELQKVGLKYTVAVTEDRKGKRAITSEADKERVRKRRKYENESDEDWIG